MLGESNLLRRTGWFDRARLWRFVLLMRRDGYWDPTPGVALGLLAQFRRPANPSLGPEAVGRMPPSVACMHHVEADSTQDIQDEGDPDVRFSLHPRFSFNVLAAGVR